MKRWLALCLAALALAGCTGKAPTDQLQRVTMENERLTAANQALTTEKERLTSEHQLLVQEVDRLRDLSSRLQKDLSDAVREARSVPSSLVEPRYLQMVAETDSWTYRKRLEADLDEDGVVETVTVVTSAFVDPKTGEVGWDDGHPWFIFVDEPDGTRTTLFASWVQLGRLQVMTAWDSPVLLVQMDGGAGFSVYQITYRGPQQSEAVQLLSLLTRDQAIPRDGLYYRE